MVRSTLLGLALAAGFLFSIPAGNARPAVLHSLTMKQSLVHTAGDLEVCYWKQKRNGRWKFKCDD
jgi:hypothetical protein